MKNMIKISLVMFLVSILASCNNSMNDLDKYFEEAKKAPPRPIDPLPEINSPEIFVYEAQELRDPFSNDLEILEEHNTEENNFVEGEGPDLSRRKELLENFPLDSLYMVGTYSQEGSYWGLIEDPEGVIHRVSMGQYMGQNYGEIVMINEDQIDVSEWIPDGLGGWIKREASIALREEE